MSKESLVYQTESLLQKLEENNFKLLFTTHGFQLMGIVTWDRKILDESLGVKRRMIKGLKFQNGTPIPEEERVFETSLHRKNPLSGQLDEIIVHEDDHIILMERKSFELDDSDDNFQFMKNMHWMNKTQQLLDEIDAAYRRINRLKDEQEEMALNVDHFTREAQAAKEKQKYLTERVTTLSRENATLQEQVGNLRAAYNHVRATNLTHESMIDEQLANAAEEGTVRGMNSDDKILHAAEQKAKLYLQMRELEPETAGTNETLQFILDELDKIKGAILPEEKGVETPEKQKQEGQGVAPQ